MYEYSHTSNIPKNANITFLHLVFYKFNSDSLMIYGFVEVVLLMQLLPNFNDFSDTKNLKHAFPCLLHSYKCRSKSVSVTLLHCRGMWG